MGEKKPVLEVKNLTRVFRQQDQAELAAVDHISFQLYPNEILGIVGESGSGKSTVARLVTRLLDATEGEIFFQGEDITRLRGTKLRKICRQFQMVFQSPAASFDPRRTLGSGIEESLRNIGLPRRKRQARVRELLEMCGLPGTYADRYPHQVSGGQCQRAAIARALAADPRLLVCDEATSALDVTVQKQVMELLAGLKEQQGMSYLFICHDLALVQNFCDRVLVMEKGKIVEEGAAGQVIRHPRNEYTRQLIEAVL